MSTLAARPVSSLLRGLLCTAGVALTALLGACDNSSTSASSPTNAKPNASTSTAPTTAAAPTSTGAEILIGHYGSLTGPEATFGRSTDNGIKLAIEEINAAGGVSIGGVSHKIKVISEDTEGKPEKAGTVVTKLITSDKVVALLGEVASGVTLAAAPVAQQFGVPMITPSSTNPQCTAVGDMIFRVCFIDPFQGFVCAKFAIKELGAKKAAILYDQSSPYSVGFNQYFAEDFKKLGGELVSVEAYNKGESNFNPLLTKIREKNPDVLFIPGYYTDVANIAIQARKLGMKLPLLGGDGWDSVELAKNGGDAIEGAFYSNHYAPDQPTDEIRNFVSKYKEKHGEIPDGLAALGYDAARVLLEAMQRANSVDGKVLRDAIASTKDFKGVTGSITINEKRDAVKPAVIVEMKGGKPVFRARVEP